MKTLCLIAALLFTTGVSAQGVPGTAGPDTAARLGEKIAQAFNDRDAKALASLIDGHSFALRTAKVHGGLDAGDHDDFVRGLEGVGLSRMTSEYIQGMGDAQASARFMRATNTIPARALVRLELGQNGFDYLEFIVETRAGRTRAVDWFLLTTGELVSVSVGGIAQLLTTNDPSLIGRLLGLERIDDAALKKLQKVGELRRAGKYAEALTTVRQLPAPMTNSRTMLTIQAQLAIRSKQDDEYKRILGKIAEKYSADPAVAFMLVDYYFAKKDLPNLLKAIETMEKRVGADAVTQELRAVAYSGSGDFASALKHADESVRLEPDRLSGHDVRATFLVALGRFPEAVAAYRNLEKQFEMHFTREMFEKDPHFAKFVASPAFRGWLGK